jgi:DNA-binding PadR family transcriptional regulator
MDPPPEIELLLRLDEAYSKPNGEGRQQAIELTDAHRDIIVTHHALPMDFDIDQELLHSLERKGMIDQTWLVGDTTQLRVTDAGRRVAEEWRALEADHGPPAEGAVRLDWAEVALPTLRAAYTAWTARGAPANGVSAAAVARELGRADDDPEIYRAIALLIDAITWRVRRSLRRTTSQPSSSSQRAACSSLEVGRRCRPRLHRRRCSSPLIDRSRRRMTRGAITPGATARQRERGRDRHVDPGAVPRPQG